MERKTVLEYTVLENTLSENILPQFLLFGKQTLDYSLSKTSKKYTFHIHFQTRLYEDNNSENTFLELFWSGNFSKEIKSQVSRIAPWGVL